MRCRAGACAVVVFLGILATVRPCAAQEAERNPSPGTVAAGADLGFFVPREGFDVAVAIAGFGEYYVTPRLSVRGLIGWARPGYDLSGLTCVDVPEPGCDGAALRQIRGDLSGVYNWEGGIWHPFVLAGVGGAFLRDTLFDRSGTRFSVHLGGGIEYFARPDVTVKGELTYHAVRHPTFDPDPSGLILTVGLKRYFR
jgi:hypothetical protein